jgi:hypothetical protein
MIAKPPIEDIIPRDGMKLRRSGAEWIGPCLVLGGRDQFSINIKKQVWNCRGCGKGGDVIDLIRHLDGVDYVTACRMLGCDEARPIVKPKKITIEADETNIDLALRIWKETIPCAALFNSYFSGRKLQPPSSPDVRFLPLCPFGRDRLPCVVALYRDIHSNEPNGIHRMAVDVLGHKLGRLTLGPTMTKPIIIDDTDRELEETRQMAGADPDGPVTPVLALAPALTVAWQNSKGDRFRTKMAARRLAALIAGNPELHLPAAAAVFALMKHPACLLHYDADVAVLPDADGGYAVRYPGDTMGNAINRLCKEIK